MDRYETAALVIDERDGSRQTVDILREQFPDGPQGLSKEQVAVLSRRIAEMYCLRASEVQLNISAWLKDFGWVKPEPKEPGRCGECRWWDVPSNKVGRCHRCSHPSMRDGVWTCDDMTCPRFEAKPDKYEELARELLAKKAMDGNTVWYYEDVNTIADFLRERVTVKEKNDG